MKIEKLLLEYQRKGVKLSLCGEKLRFAAPQNVLTEADKEKLRANKEQIIRYLADHQESEIIEDEEERYEEFPLTDIQTSYLIGQDDIYKFGGTNCKIYSEFEYDALEIKKVQNAWEQVVCSNDMLHAVIEKNGVQRILKDFKVPQIVYRDYCALDEAEATEHLQKLRRELTQKKYPAGSWPLFDMEMTKLKDKYILHFSLDMLVADFVSVNLIADEFEQFYYQMPEKSLTKLSFRDIVIYRDNMKHTVEGKRKYETDKAYWMEKVETMPGTPEFPVVENAQEESGHTLFKQYRFVLDKEKYARFCKAAREESITPSNLILTAYAETLKMISKNKSFCIDVTMSDRPAIHPEIMNVVGDFTIASILEISDKNYGTYLEEAKEIQERLWEDLGHNSFPSSEVLREMGRKLKSEIAVPAVFTSTIGNLNTNINRKGKIVYTISQTPQVLIDCQVLEIGGELRVNWDVREGVFMEKMAEQAFETFYQLVCRLATVSGIKQKVTTVLPESVKKVRTQANATDKDIEEKYLYEGFLKNLKERPKAEALYADGVTYSYEELFGYVQAVRASLQREGMEKNDVVALSISKGVWQIATVLAILTLGGTYLPLDVHQPSERAEKIIQSSRAKYCVLERMDSIKDDITCKIDVLSLQPQKGICDFEIIRTDLQAPAYIIFTSGSTGEPKGVVISHAAASNTILDINERFEVNQEDVLLNVANLGFDLSVYDIFGAFFAGAKLVQVTESEGKNPEHWIELLRNQQVTVWNSVPAQMKMLTMLLAAEEEQKIDTLRLVLLSGDWIPTDLPKDISKCFPNANPISLGGATEAAIWSIFYPMNPNATYERSVPYGKPLYNQRFYVLDEKLREVPDWVTGGIYIAGKGLALEYFGDKKLTDEKFIYVEHLQERLYKTGDIGRYMPDGNIEFQGREDFQVKIRGHRVELGEIEAAIADVVTLKDSKVIAVTHNKVISICMFGVTEGGESLPEKEWLDAQLAKKIPKYMIPSFYIRLENIPLTANGKVDNKALTQKAIELIEKNRRDTQQEKDLSEVEKKVYSIWCEIFNTEGIDRDEDFFDCGGDSVLIVKLITELENRFGYKMSIADVYAGPTIREMAENLSEG